MRIDVELEITLMEEVIVIEWEDPVELIEACHEVMGHKPKLMTIMILQVSSAAAEVLPRRGS